jgi:nuclear pore complex protein Nup54
MSSIFGNSTTQSQNQANKPGGLFSLGSSTTGSGLFGGQQQSQQQKPFGLNTSQQASSSIFGPSASAQQQQGSSQQGLFTFGQAPAPQRPLDQTLRFGTSTDQNALQQMWEEGRGLGVYRSIPAQMNVVKDKWDAATLVSPLRAYLYQHVGDEKEALRYRPGPGEDEDKWEDAIQKRPGGEWVPLLVRGFMEMGGKVKQQGEALARCNMMLQEINNSLNLQLEMHQQKVAARLAECKRRQQATSRRILALAVKVQILRNKGYVMDNAEEELKVKLEKLEKDVLDPSLDAREQEIWARMLGIRERAKRLKTEMDKLAPMAAAEEPALDEGTIKTAKQVYPLTWSTVQSLTSSQILEAYDTQLRHLQKELQLVQQEYEDWQKLSKAQDSEPLRRR